MAVAMTHWRRPPIPKTLFDQGYTLASVIANEFNEVSSDLYLSALVEAGLILFVLTSLVNIGAYYVLRRMNRLHKHRSERAGQEEGTRVAETTGVA